MTNVVEKQRVDSWTEEDDLILAEIVLRYIREGKTQTKAFEEVAEKLNRTDGACAFRWNNVVKERFESAIEIAKKHRLALKKNKNKNLGNVKEVSETKRTKKKQAKSKKPSIKPLKKQIEVTKQELKEKNEETLENLDVIQALKVLTEFVKENGVEKTSLYNKEEIEELKKENKLLKEKLQETEKEKEELERDYEMINKVVNQARRMVEVKEDVRFKYAN